MSKPYLVINVVEGKVGVIRVRPTFEQAIDLAVAMVLEQTDAPADFVRSEIEENTNFVSGDIEVMLAQWNDD